MFFFGQISYEQIPSLISCLYTVTVHCIVHPRSTDRRSINPRLILCNKKFPKSKEVKQIQSHIKQSRLVDIQVPLQYLEAEVVPIFLKVSYLLMSQADAPQNNKDIEKQYIPRVCVHL